MLSIVSVAVPPLLTVSESVLVALTYTLPKFRLVGFTENTGDPAIVVNVLVGEYALVPPSF